MDMFLTDGQQSIPQTVLWLGKVRHFRTFKLLPKLQGQKESASNLRLWMRS
jgi:hypothetical protein